MIAFALRFAAALVCMTFAAFVLTWMIARREVAEISAEPLPGPPAAVPASLPSPTRPRNVVRPDGPGTR